MYSKNLQIKQTIRAKLSIEPLAPLSMVSILPGSYYRSARKPTKYMICGMLENILDFHYDKSTRNKMLKEMKKYLKKHFKHDFDIRSCISPSGYISILYPLIEIELELFSTPLSYDDLWTQHLKHNDKRHVDGVRNSDYRVYPKIRILEKKYFNAISQSKDKKEIADLKKELSKKIEELKIQELKKNIFPNFYQSPKRREFIIVNEKYQYRISTNEGLFNTLQKAIDENNIAYLGTSEGWVNVEIEKI
ncbi:MAG: type I-PGING CRISPR-associated protein Cas5p [Candidatus Woesearchaeota archaeon]